MTSTVKMGIHVGRALKFITDNYPTLNKVILELVQNSLDSDAKNICIAINYRNDSLKVRDNGSGISIQKFSEAVRSVCNSSKKAGKLGQFGIGLLSPLGKCEEFIITSAPQGPNPKYRSWYFNSKEILRSEDLPEIAYKDCPEIVYSRNLNIHLPNKRPVDWYTEVAVNNFTKDSSINAIAVDDLRSLILAHFSEAMKKLDTVVTVRIMSKEKEKTDLTFKAADFKGEKLNKVIYGSEENGQTSFEMYVSPKTKKGRQGQILVGVKGNDFRIPFSVFIKSIRDMINVEAYHILTSGTFEGAIISDQCTLHQNRKEFENNEKLLYFCIHINDWVASHGQKQISGMKDAEKDVWLQAVGSLALRNLEEKIKTEMPHLLSVVKAFKNGTIGSGHNGFDKTRKPQDFSSTDWKDVLKNAGQEKVKDVTPKPHTEPKTDHPEHTPFIVAGPKGQKRRVVRGHSTGIQFVYEELPGNENHWEFNKDSGMLVFNTRSDVWDRMEQAGERNLILYQEYVAIKALEMQLVPPPQRPTVFEFLQKELKTAAIFIVSTSALQPRKAKSEIGKVIRN